MNFTARSLPTLMKKELKIFAIFAGSFCGLTVWPLFSILFLNVSLFELLLLSVKLFINFQVSLGLVIALENFEL